VCREPDRFERMVWLLPAGLDLPFGLANRYHLLAEDLEGKTPQEALETVLNDPARVAEYLETPWRLELDRVLWQHDDPDALAHAIHGVVEDWPIPDRELLRDVATPTIVVTIEGDEIHPAELGRLLPELLPNAELIALRSQEELLRRIPQLVARVSAFIAGEDGAGQHQG
jgi:pimeloyl-ACP methyl ester carboxylesterase